MVTDFLVITWQYLDILWIEYGLKSNFTRGLIQRGTFICAHAWIFFKLCMIITIYIQAMKMYLFNSITKTRTQEATLSYSHYEVIPVSKVLCPYS